ncbi:MAG: hypothetical protein WC238_04460 [Parcubacteria group bacterium]|jgi:hypothetical protein
MHLFKNKTFIFRKKIILLLLVLTFSFYPQPQPAQAWLSLAAAAWKDAREMIRETISAIQLGAAQQAAVDALNSEMSYLITGKNSGGPMIITDWRAYAVKQPVARTNVFINDYISQSLRGRGSLTGYVSKTAEGIGMSYLSQLEQSAKRATSDIIQPRVTFQGDPAKIFSGPRPFQRFTLLFSGINYEPIYKTYIQDKYQEELENQKTIAQLEATSSGFLGKKVNGITVNPAGLIEAQVAKVQNMGKDIITNATNWRQVVIGAVSNTINQSMINGIGQIQAGVHREVTNVRSQAIGEMNKAISNIGPGALYRR